MHELNKAPSLQNRSDGHGGAGLPRVVKDGADKSHSSSYRRSKGSAALPGASSGQVSRSPHRSGSGRRSGNSGSQSRPVNPAPPQAVASTASSGRRSSRRSGQSQPMDAMAAVAAPAAPAGQQRPRSILETPIQDAARDAYYGAGGAGESEEQQLMSPSARGLRKSSRRPSSQRLTSAQRTYSGPRPRSKGSKTGGVPNGMDRAAVTVE